MRRILLAFTILLGLQFAAPASSFGSDDLLEAARKAQARRRKADKNKKPGARDEHTVLTNHEIQSTSAGTFNQTGKDEPSIDKPKDGEAISTTSSAPPAEGEKKEAESKDEGFWRGRLQDAEAGVAAARKRLSDLNAGINESRRNSTAIDDPNIQQQKRQELLNQQGELKAAQQAVSDAEKAVAGVREEARRGGAPPGWLR